MPAPVIAGPQRVVARFGHRLDLGINASSTTPVAYTASGALPTGVSLDASTGLISGVPTQSGVFRLILTASNAGGSASTWIIITVPEVQQLIGADPAAATWTGARPVPVSVTGLQKGDRFRVAVDGRTVRTAAVRRSGPLAISISLPKVRHDTAHRIEISTTRRVSDPATVASTSFRITSLAAKKTLKVISTVTKGVPTIVVERLAPGEKVVVEVKGHVVAGGHADRHGEYAFARREAGARTRMLTVTGAAKGRHGTLRVRNLQR